MTRKTRAYQHLGPFSDLPAAANRSKASHPRGAKTLREHALECLHFSPGPAVPQGVRIEQRWERDGVLGEAVSWSVGYGPRTEAFLLRPADRSGPLPGILALHDHGAFKFHGKEKIADGPRPGVRPGLKKFRATYYEGAAIAGDLARAGFAVLVHDTFLWGSRRVPPEAMPEWTDGDGRLARQKEPPEDFIRRYNRAAIPNEHTMAKYCTVLGTSLPAVVNYEDRVALSYLCARPEVREAACLGLSGGGLRSGLLNATDDRIKAAVVAGSMTTYAGALDRNIVCHTWMLFPPRWTLFGDWPDLVACRAPSPLLVQYDRDDQLFTPEGMEDAHRKLRAIFRRAGRPGAYCGEFFPGRHKFDREMQRSAAAWLKKVLGSP